MGTSPFASKNPFAHLLGRKPSGKKAEEDDRKDDTESKAEDDDADAEEGDDTEDEDDKKSKKSKKAEDDSDDADAENDDSDGDTEEDSDKDNAKKASGGKKGKTYADGRAFERARCAKIFGCAAAADRPDVAARLAFNTDMNPDAAIEVLTVAAEAGGRQSSRRPSGLSERMASLPTPKVGATAPQQQPTDPKSPSAVAAAIIEAGRKRRGEK